jgi:hypothetical protein
MEMKSRIFAVLAVSMICCGLCRGTVSIVKNGSFENDGFIGYVTQDARPEHWCDVSYDESKFSVYVWNDWSSHGEFSLTFSTRYNASFQGGDSATIAQSVFTEKVRQITFDLFLTTEWPDINWDSNLFSAIVTVDDNVIWDSNQPGIFENGLYHIEVNDLNFPGGPHILALGIKSNTAAQPYYYSYYAKWDSVMFDTFCTSVSYLPADFNEDGVVDIYDLKVLADGWLNQAGPDLTGDGNVNFSDFAVLAGSWMSTTPTESICDTFFLDPNFILLDADLNDDGIVDYYDVFILSGDWLNNGGSCVRTDLNEDGYINFADYALLIEYWQQPSGYNL